MLENNVKSRLHWGYFTIYRNINHRLNFISIFYILATYKWKLKLLFTCLLELKKSELKNQGNEQLSPKTQALWGQFNSCFFLLKLKCDSPLRPAQ